MGLTLSLSLLRELQGFSSGCLASAAGVFSVEQFHCPLSFLKKDFSFNSLPPLLFLCVCVWCACSNVCRGQAHALSQELESGIPGTRDLHARN